MLNADQERAAGILLVTHLSGELATEPGHPSTKRKLLWTYLPSADGPGNHRVRRLRNCPNRCDDAQESEQEQPDTPAHNSSLEWGRPQGHEKQLCQLSFDE